MDGVTVGIGAALVAVQCVYVAVFWRRSFKHPLSAAVGICAGGVLLVVAAFALRLTLAPSVSPADLLIQYVAVGGLPELAWALVRRDRELRAALADAQAAIRGQ